MHTNTDILPHADTDISVPGIGIGIGINIGIGRTLGPIYVSCVSLCKNWSKLKTIASVHATNVHFLLIICFQI